MSISNNSNSNSYKDIGIQSVAYVSCLSPLLSCEDQISLSLPLASESTMLHSGSVWLLSCENRLIYTRHLGLYPDSYRCIHIRAGPEVLGHKKAKIYHFLKISFKKKFFCDLEPQVLGHKKDNF